MNKTSHLYRGLNLKHAIAIVIGTIIGTGVFLKTATMAQLLGNPKLVLLAWFVGGILSLAGALTYAELGAILPHAGGEFEYLKKSYGELPAFLFGWMRFWIGSPGSIAAYAVGAMTFLSSFYNLDFIGGKNIAAILVILFFSILNCLSVSVVGKFQSYLTNLKILTILSLSFGIFFYSHEKGNWSHLNEVAPGLTFSLSAFSSALLASLWAYDGWNNLSMVGGEIKNPEKNIPKALSLGVLGIFIIYGLVNLSYFYALPLGEVMTSHSKAFPNSLPVATNAALTFMGERGIIIISLAFILSAIGAMNGSILTGARVPYAMAHEGLFFKSVGKLGKKNKSPIVSVIVQAIIASGLALSGTFDQLTDYVVFSSWIFYALVTSSIFRFRKIMPLEMREAKSYKTWGYPFVPFLFIIVAVILLLNTIYSSPHESLIGLAFIILGIPVFFYFKSSFQKS